MKYWEIIAGNLSEAGWNWGISSGFTHQLKPNFIADAHKDDGKRYISRADEILTAFLELECTLPKQNGYIELRNCGPTDHADKD